MGDIERLELTDRGIMYFYIFMLAVAAAGFLALVIGAIVTAIKDDRK